MGWVWKDEADEETASYDVAEFRNSNPSISEADRCSTRKIVKSFCRTEEVESGRFVRKCEKNEQILRDCVGRPSEVVQSNKEYTEEDVSHQMKEGSFPLESSELGPFNFPGLRSDIESIERNFFGGLSRFFEAAEDVKNGFFNVFGPPNLYEGHSSSSPSRRRGMPVEGQPPEEAPTKSIDPQSGNLDFSGLARDV